MIRPRFTLRRLLVAVALFTVPLAFFTQGGYVRVIASGRGSARAGGELVVYLHDSQLLQLNYWSQLTGGSRSSRCNIGHYVLWEYYVWDTSQEPPL